MITNISIVSVFVKDIDESKRFLDTYYTMDYPRDVVAGWTATGSVRTAAACRGAFRWHGCRAAGSRIRTALSANVHLSAIVDSCS